MIEITEESAQVLFRICDAVTLKGSATKLAVGKAQSELEAALTKPPAVEAEPDESMTEPVQDAQNAN